MFNTELNNFILQHDYNNKNAYTILDIISTLAENEEAATIFFKKFYFDLNKLIKYADNDIKKKKIIDALETILKTYFVIDVTENKKKNQKKKIFTFLYYLVKKSLLDAEDDTNNIYFNFNLEISNKYKDYDIDLLKM